MNRATRTSEPTVELDPRTSDEVRALCLCCIGRSADLDVPPGGGYESDQRLRAIDEGILRAIVIDLDAEYLTGVGTAERLESVEWVGPRAERHQALIAAAAAQGPVIPARFGCVFSGEEPLREMLSSNESLLWTSLEQVDGASEFVIRVMMDREQAVEAMLGDEGAADAASMLRRRSGRDAGHEIGPWLAERLRGPIDAVQGVARASCRHRIVETQRAGREVVAHWAFLVGHAERASFEQAVGRAAEDLRGIGAEIVCGGPWAPYSFAPSVAAA